MSEAEGSYRLSIYDYTAELTVRDGLQEVLKTAIAELDHEATVREVASLDQRVAFSTRACRKGVASGLSGHEGFWWFRVPIRVGDELRRDLESDDLLG